MFSSSSSLQTQNIPGIFWNLCPSCVKTYFKKIFIGWARVFTELPEVYVYFIRSILRLLVPGMCYLAGEKYDYTMTLVQNNIAINTILIAMYVDMCLSRLPSIQSTPSTKKKRNLAARTLHSSHDIYLNESNPVDYILYTFSTRRKECLPKESSPPCCYL